jgi:hypothetical protein
MSGTARERVWALMVDGLWHTGPEIASPEVGGSEGLRRLREFRKAGCVIDKRRRSGGTWEYRLVHHDPAILKGKPGWGTASKEVTVPPENPLTPSAYGQAAAITCWALNVIGSWPVRVHWCVDLERDVPADRYAALDPSKPEEQTVWGQYLTRFREHLDRQAWGSGGKARIALTVRYESQATGQRLGATFDLPWVLNVACVVRSQPPVGVWRLVWHPSAEDPGAPFEGDTLPASFWYDGIPF